MPRWTHQNPFTGSETCIRHAANRKEEQSPIEIGEWGWNGTCGGAGEPAGSVEEAHQMVNTWSPSFPETGRETLSKKRQPPLSLENVKYQRLKWTSYLMVLHYRRYGPMLSEFSSQRRLIRDLKSATKLTGSLHTLIIWTRIGCHHQREKWIGFYPWERDGDTKRWISQLFFG